MQATRRTVLGGAAALALTPAWARTAPDGFTRAYVIDGLGGPDDPDADDSSQSTTLTPRGIAQIKASGVTAWQVTVSEVGNSPTSWDTTLANIANTEAMIDANPAVFVRGRSAADLRAAKAAGKAALIYGTQDTAMVGPTLDRLDVLAGLGVRVVQLTYNLRNLSGDGSLEPADAGLSKLGRATIARIEKNKQLLDFAHGGARTIAEGLAAATRPPTISHTGCRSLHDNPRNVWDASLKACADKGGVVGIYWMPFLVPNGKPTTADLIRHMAHAVDVCGEDHVGIGTDGSLSKIGIDDKARAAQKKFFEERSAKGIAAPGEGPDVFNMVAELNSPDRFRLLYAALERARWPAARIDKVMGGNLLRLYGEAWGA